MNPESIWILLGVLFLGGAIGFYASRKPRPSDIGEERLRGNYLAGVNFPRINLSSVTYGKNPETGWRWAFRHPVKLTKISVENAACCDVPPTMRTLPLASRIDEAANRGVFMSAACDHDSVAGS